MKKRNTYRHHRPGILAFGLSAALLLTGCTPVTAVQERCYIQAAELCDPEQDALTVRLHAFAPEVPCCTGSSTALTAAVAAAQTQAGKELFLGHLELLCFQETISATLLRTCMEEYRLSPACRLLCLPDPQQTLPEDTDTLHLTDCLHRSEEQGILPQTDLFHVRCELAGADHAALVPVYDRQAFSMAIVREHRFCGTLSDEAAKGLCWLRRENYPEQILTPDASAFAVSTARTTLSAKMEQDAPVVTVQIRIRGTGDAEQAREQVLLCCLAAEEEALRQYDADVCGLAACIARDCNAYYTTHTIAQLKSAVTLRYDIQVTALGF